MWLLIPLLFLLLPDPAWAGAAKDTFGAGGPGLPIVQIFFIGTAGYLFALILQAFKLGQIAGLVKLLTFFCCILVGVGVIVKVFKAVTGALGIEL